MNGQYLKNICRYILKYITSEDFFCFEAEKTPSWVEPTIGVLGYCRGYSATGGRERNIEVCLHVRQTDVAVPLK